MEVEVEVEVVTVTLTRGKSAPDDLMEWLFNPTLNGENAEVCAVCQTGLPENNYHCGAEKVREGVASVYTGPLCLILLFFRLKSCFVLLSFLFPLIFTVHFSFLSVLLKAVKLSTRSKLQNFSIFLISETFIAWLAA